MSNPIPPCEKCTFDAQQTTEQGENPRAVGCFIGSTIAASELAIIFTVTAGLPEAVRLPVDAAAITLTGLTLALMAAK